MCSGKNILMLSITLSVLLSYYLSNSVLSNGGGDFSLRLAESSYFTLGINPYDVYVKSTPSTKGIGDPNVYSFVSYIFLSPLTLLPTKLGAMMVYVILDLAAFVLVIRILEAEGYFDPISFPITATVLMISAFFLQHTWTLNYNVIVSACLLLAIWADRRGDWLLFLLAGFLVALKPSIFIPFFALLIARRSFGRAFALLALCLGCLALACLQMNISPREYVQQLLSTAEAWTDVPNYGTLSLLLLLQASPSVLYSTLGAFLLIGAASLRHKGDLISDFGLCVLASLAFFYNNVHSWVMAYPLLIVWLNLRLRGLAPFWVGILLIAFLVIPRMMALYPENIRDYLVVGHNLLRFGALGAVVAYFFDRTNPRRHDIVGTTTC